MTIKYFYILLFISLQFSQKINTIWGPCMIRIYQGQINDIDKIEERIKYQMEKMNVEWGEAIKRPLTIYITFSKDDFFKQSRSYVPEWGIAVAKQDPDRIIIQGPTISGITFDKLLQILDHELNHIYLNRINNSNTFPHWYKEGMAMRQANEFNMKHRIKISAAKWNNQLFSLDELEYFINVRKTNVGLAYAQSAAIVFALEYFFGKEVHDSIFSKMRQGNDFWESLEEITNFEKKDLNLKIDSYIDKNYNWMFLLNFSNYLFIIFPIILVVSFLYKKFENNKKLKKWELEESIEN